MKLFKQQGCIPAVWVARIVVGATFMISGWAKAIDPWGFIFKIEEYLAVWQMTVTREIVMVTAVGIAATEFTIGLLTATGCLRRSTPIAATALMAFMLPLTAYIAIADPVADCGCFGDFLILSNTATLLKNIVLTALCVFLLVYNTSCRSLFLPGLQWMVIATASAFCLVLSWTGYRIQPVVDFRAYPLGTSMCAGDTGYTGDTGDNTLYTYSRNGETKSFTLDNLPDSTWTFIGAEAPQTDGAGQNYIAIFDGDEELAPEDVFSCDGEQLVLTVSEPTDAYLTRARMANELNDLMERRGGSMIALVAADGSRLDAWRELALPRYDAYTAEDTSLKVLVRGVSALVYLRNGKIVWKRTLASIPVDAAIGDKQFDAIKAVDSGFVHYTICATFVVVLLIVYSLNFPGTLLNRLRRKVEIDKK